MTLPPERIGDKGQRYEVRVHGWPQAGWNVVGWGSKLERATEFGQGFKSCPGARQMEVWDRKTGERAAWEDWPWKAG